MTKFIFDTKEIMVRAWELARKRAKEMNAYWDRRKEYQLIKPASFYIQGAMKAAWAEAKEAMSGAISKAKVEAKPAGRYVELLSVAEKNKLNHGRAWYCSEYDIQCRGIHPSYEGESICYVYAN